MNQEESIINCVVGPDGNEIRVKPNILLLLMMS
jgi:hypothetical protein